MKFRKFKKSASEVTDLLLFNPSYCQDLSSHEIKQNVRCIDKPSGWMYYIYIIQFILFIKAITSSIYAIETDNTDDDTQWLIFWMVILLISQIDKFISIIFNNHYIFHILRLIGLILFMNKGALYFYLTIRKLLLLIYKLCIYLSSNSNFKHSAFLFFIIVSYYISLNIYKLYY